MKITDHFSSSEFACHNGTPYPLDEIDTEDRAGRTWRETRLQPLCEMLEIIREAAGGEPIHIDSGYRTLAYDQRLYDADAGAGNLATPQGSQHPKGRAADITHPTLSPARLRGLIGDLFRQGKLPQLGGVGYYASFVHVDVRHRPGSLGGANDGHLSQWSGSRRSNIA